MENKKLLDEFEHQGLMYFSELCKSYMEAFTIMQTPLLIENHRNTKKKSQFAFCRFLIFDKYRRTFNNNLKEWYEERTKLINEYDYNHELEQHKIAVLLHTQYNFIYDIALNISEYI
jgi:hypothetical protein